MSGEADEDAVEGGENADRSDIKKKEGEEWKSDPSDWSISKFADGTEENNLEIKEENEPEVKAEDDPDGTEEQNDDTDMENIHVAHGGANVKSDAEDCALAGERVPKTEHPSESQSQTFIFLKEGIL